MSKKFVIFLFFVFHSFSFAASKSDRYIVKVAVIDIQHILNHSIVVKNIRKDINAINKANYDEMLKKENELKEEEKALLVKKDKINKDLFKKEVDKFNKKVASTQSLAQEKKIKVEALYEKSILNVHKSVIQIVKQLSKERGINLVIPSSQVFFFNDSLNITYDVVNRLNKVLTHVKITNT